MEKLEIGLILQLILQLLQILKPSDLQKIKNEIAKKEREIEEKRKKILKAVVEGDINSINSILFD